MSKSPWWFFPVKFALCAAALYLLYHATDQVGVVWRTVLCIGLPGLVAVVSSSFFPAYSYGGTSGGIGVFALCAGALVLSMVFAPFVVWMSGGLMTIAVIWSVLLCGAIALFL